MIPLLLKNKYLRVQILPVYTHHTIHSGDAQDRKTCKLFLQKLISLYIFTLHFFINSHRQTQGISINNNYITVHILILDILLFGNLLLSHPHFYSIQQFLGLHPECRSFDFITPSLYNLFLSVSLLT